MLSWIANFFTSLFEGIINIILLPVRISFIYPIMSAIVKILGSLLYTVLCMPFYLALDFLQMFFRVICGLEGSISIGNGLSGGVSQTGEGVDLVLAFITSKSILNIFFALSLIALVLLFISTIVAIIKTEYTFDKAGNSKGPIFGRALKAIALYFTIPVACVMGIFFSNMMLKALDQATNTAQSQSISGMLFSSSVTRANRINTEQAFVCAYMYSSRLNANWYFNSSQSVEGGKVVGTYGNPNDPFSLLTSPNDYKSEIRTEEANKLANLINAAFATGYTDFSKWNGNIISAPFEAVGVASDASRHFSDTFNAYFVTLDGVGHLFATTPLTLAGFSVYNVELIHLYYNWFFFDYLQVVIVGCVILKSLFDITLGAAKRLYELVVLFVISPPIVALMPLDEGKAYKKWVGEFISRVFSLYGGVLAMNFFFMLSPIITSMNFFPNGISNVHPYLSSAMNYLPQLLFLTAGAMSIKSISKLLGGMVGAGDSLAEGGDLSKEITSKIGAAVSTVAGVAAGVATGGASAALGAAGKLAARAGGGGAEGAAAGAFGNVAGGDSGSFGGGSSVSAGGSGGPKPPKGPGGGGSGGPGAGAGGGASSAGITAGGSAATSSNVSASSGTASGTAGITSGAASGSDSDEFDSHGRHIPLALREKREAKTEKALNKSFTKQNKITDKMLAQKEKEAAFARSPEGKAAAAKLDKKNLERTKKIDQKNTKKAEALIKRENSVLYYRLSQVGGVLKSGAKAVGRGAIQAGKAVGRGALQAGKALGQGAYVAGAGVLGAAKGGLGGLKSVGGTVFGTVAGDAKDAFDKGLFGKKLEAQKKAKDDAQTAAAELKAEEQRAQDIAMQERQIKAAEIQNELLARQIQAQEEAAKKRKPKPPKV